MVTIILSCVLAVVCVASVGLNVWSVMKIKFLVEKNIAFSDEISELSNNIGMMKTFVSNVEVFANSVSEIVNQCTEKFIKLEQNINNIQNCVGSLKDDMSENFVMLGAGKKVEESEFSTSCEDVPEQPVRTYSSMMSDYANGKSIADVYEQEELPDDIENNSELDNEGDEPEFVVEEIDETEK